MVWALSSIQVLRTTVNKLEAIATKNFGGYTRYVIGNAQMVSGPDLPKYQRSS